MASPVVKSVTKSPEAYRTISEVALELDLPQHVLRFWETRFTQIRPMKKGGGRRYYRTEDVELLKGIRTALYSQGLTIRGVLKIIKEQGVSEISALGAYPYTPQLPLPSQSPALHDEDDDQMPVPPEEEKPAPLPRQTFSSVFGTGLTAMSYGRGLSSVPTIETSPLVKFAPLEDEPEDLPAFTIGMRAYKPVEPIISKPAVIKPVLTPPLSSSVTRPKFAPLPQESLTPQEIKTLQLALNELAQCQRLLART